MIDNEIIEALDCCSDVATELDKKVEKAKSEAIKEFAKRLKEEFINDSACGKYVMSKIDTLVKEKTGEK